MIDRVRRNTLALVRVEPAPTTVIDIIEEWNGACGAGCTAAAIVDLAERLRIDRWRLAFAEDGVLVGQALEDAIRHQAQLLTSEEWPSKNRLRQLADQVRTTLGEYGLL